MALLAGSMRVPRPATGMTALVTFGMWVPWCAASWAFGVERWACTDCRSDIFVTIRVVKPAYIALMFIGPLLHCGPRPLLRGSAPAPQCKGRYPLANPSGPRSSLILVYQNQLSIRGQGAVPAPTRSFGVIQTMLLVLVTFGL